MSIFFSVLGPTTAPTGSAEPLSPAGTSGPLGAQSAPININVLGPVGNGPVPGPHPPYSGGASASWSASGSVLLNDFAGVAAAASWKASGSCLANRFRFDGVATASAWSASGHWLRGGRWHGAASARPWTAAGTWPHAGRFAGVAVGAKWTAIGAAKIGKGWSGTATGTAWTATGTATLGRAWSGTATGPAWSATGRSIHEGKWQGAAVAAWSARGAMPPRGLRVAGIARGFPWTAQGHAAQTKDWSGAAVGPGWTARGSASWQGVFVGVARWGTWTAAGACAAVAPNSVTFCVNTETFAATQWHEFPFVALGAADGVPFGATAGGVYQLTGEDDAGALIASVMLSGQSVLGDGRLKRVPVVHGDLDGKARIVAEVDGKRHDYHFGNRALLPQGLLGKRWAFGVKNVGGAAVTLRSLEPVITVLSRWVK